jgi:hypothetical protein
MDITGYRQKELCLNCQAAARPASIAGGRDVAIAMRIRVFELDQFIVRDMRLED